MAVSTFQLNLSPALPSGLSPESALSRKQNSRGQKTFPGHGRFEAISWRPATVWGRRIDASLVQGKRTPRELQEFLWQQFFSDTTQWCDTRWTKETPRHPDFRHKNSKDALWLSNRYKPAWVDIQLATLDAQVYAGISGPPGYISTSVPGAPSTLAVPQDRLDVETCRKLCEDGPVSVAVDALNDLLKQGCEVPSDLFYRVLKRCIAQKDLVLGRRIHALILGSGYEGNAFLANHLIGLYASHRRLDEAMQVFSKVSKPDAYMWASILLANARHGQPTQAIRLYLQMRESAVKPDNHIFVAVLKACASAGDLAAGKDVHAHILASTVKPDIFVRNCLVDMYAKCGSLEDAQRVFDKLSRKDVVTWTALIAGYAQQGMGQEALSLYNNMQQEGITPPNSITFVSLLQACAGLGVAGLEQGKQLHAQIEGRGLQADVVVANSLVNMYIKCGSLGNAQRVFDRLSQKDLVTWNTVMAGYAQQGMGREALSLYSRMQQECNAVPDSVTFVCLLQACAGVGVAALQQGMQLHAQIGAQGVQADVVVGGSLVNMYAKCGSLEEARNMFDRLPQKNVVSWNAMIGGYAQLGMCQEALSLYSSMQQEGITLADSVTFVCLLQACASVAALPVGKQLHAQIEERGLQGDVILGRSLVNMYAKCGSLEDAQQVFDSMQERDIVAWGSLIAGYARHGESDVVFNLVERMRQVGIQPNAITLLGVLTVCSHVGLVEKGRKYFEAMTTDYGITPTIEHYTCMVDLLGRAGQLDEALVMVKTMPFQPDSTVWQSLLGACRKWSNVEVGRQAFESAVRLDEKNAAAYVSMSNIYVGAKMWEAAHEMHARRVRCGARKDPGRSWWTDMAGAVHSFVVGDKKHSESEDIYARLNGLIPKMKKEGYVPHLESSLRDITDDEKEAELCGHSEKLAIAYALNKTPEGTTIRIVKNLRVCADCHTATAYISKVEKRTIICRDASRFHVFKEGKCSCGDYW